MNCPACGAPLKNPTVTFCSKCGHKLPPLAPPEEFQAPPEPVEINRTDTPAHEFRGPKPPPIPLLEQEQANLPSPGPHALSGAPVWRCRERVWTIRDRYDVKDQSGNVLFTVVGRIVQIFPKVQFFLPHNPHTPWLTLAWRWRGLASLFNSHYVLTQPGGEEVAVFKKSLILDVIISRWHLLDPDGREFGMAEEESLIKALMNRFVAKMFRSNFNIFFDGQPAARFVRNWTLFDSYTMQLGQGANLDDLQAASLASLVVVLDKGQRR